MRLLIFYLQRCQTIEWCLIIYEIRPFEMKATFRIVYLAYYIIGYCLCWDCLAFCSLSVCGLCAPSRERWGGWKKYFDRLLSSRVAYNGLFVSQYDFLNWEDSFVHFLIVTRIQSFFCSSSWPLLPCTVHMQLVAEISLAPPPPPWAAPAASVVSSAWNAWSRTGGLA